MADLVTHAASVLLPCAWWRGRQVPVIMLGALLPDLAARLPSELLEHGGRALGITLPDPLLQCWTVLHTPAGTALVCLTVAHRFVEAERAPILRSLLLGSLAHYALDVLQDHDGRGYHLLYPLSLTDFELGWIGSEATVGWAPWLALLTAVAWWWTGRRR